MIDTIYVEQAVRRHPRSVAVCARFPAARVIECDHYGEIFNRNNQNFRLQKQNPSLILARKTGRRILPVPDGYGLDGHDGFYFSHMLNCLYDCRYCFLQGMFRSGHYVLFVNYEDFFEDMRSLCASRAQPTWFFSGYDCDSLALDPVSDFTASFIPALEGMDNAWLELRSKSTQVRSLLQRKPCARVVCAFSLNPQSIIAALEHRTPSLAARLRAIVALQQRGWLVALRFDPIILVENFREVYADFFAQVFATIDAQALHSMTLGAFRLPPAHFRRMVELYPLEPLFAGAIVPRAGTVGYAQTLEADLLDWCRSRIGALVDHVPLYTQGVAP